MTAAERRVSFAVTLGGDVRREIDYGNHRSVDKDEVEEQKKICPTRRWARPICSE